MGMILSTENNENDVLLQRIGRDAPTEIVRYILEIAASEDRHTAASLCLVSKEIHAWIDHFRYQVIILKTTDDIMQFNNVMAERGPLLQHLRTLAVWSYGFVDPQSFAKTCINLHTLHCFDNIREIRTLEEYPPNLKQFSYCGYLLQTHLSDIPLFQTITHLVFPDDVPHDFPDAPLPNLTHFACRYTTLTFGESPQTLAETLGWILDRVLQCPRLQLVVIVVQENRGDTKPTEEFVRAEMLGSIKRQIADTRIVFWVSDPEQHGSHSAVTHWDLESPTSLWEWAGRKVSLNIGS